MNCPNCGRPVSETANICPRCHTKLFHGAEQESGEKPHDGVGVKLENVERKDNKVLRTILFVILGICVAILLFIFIGILTGYGEGGWFYKFTHSQDWLNWLYRVASTFRRIFVK